MIVEIPGLTRTIHCYNRANGMVGLLEIAASHTCSVPSCTTGPDGLPGLAAWAILNVVRGAGSVIITGVQQGSALYLCDPHFDEAGEAEADTLAELLRGGAIK